jgi:predicted transposase YdaD
MTYVTNAERFGFERGIQEGRQEGLEQERSLILRLLTRRVGPIAPLLETQIRELSLLQLEDLGEALLDFTQPADLDNWLQSHQ